MAAPAAPAAPAPAAPAVAPAAAPAPAAASPAAPVAAPAAATAPVRLLSYCTRGVLNWAKGSKDELLGRYLQPNSTLRNPYISS